MSHSIPSASGVAAFFPRCADGSAQAFEPIEIRDLTEAETIAAAMLDQHRTAVAVEVFQDDQVIAVYRR